MSLLPRLLKNKMAWIAIGIILGLALIAIFAPDIAPHDPLEVELTRRLQSGSATFPLGTDHLGRCILSRLIYGARISLSIALTVTALTTTIGLIVGMIAGYGGGRVDSFLMRVCDVFLSFPNLILALAIVGVMGASRVNIVMALGASHWAWYARIVRSKVLRLKEENFIKAAVVSGTSGFQLMMKHLLPYTIAEIAVLASLDMGSTILHISTLSFLGLGIQPPAPEWGTMLNDGREFFRREPGLMFYPGMMIFLVALSFNLLGDALRDALDPRLVKTIKRTRSRGCQC
ncbi:nickel ABC transporter permease subunit NikC [Desertifilum sp. FACHB-1129]|nr:MULTISPECIES: nickel ABC transporter permease subunit NikC [Desertifilum]MBD2314401.1 nickel ABC transporter permease subunit NikC [Desertifilum sp. FACHB-1129]MBD2324904.1 nickel ABC transporter permease subunit NikC [Desertifilum sp. FACHB-866]MBD2334997.1 nickel ABC transporter permease subunit NikC [Desertifilum sp. FACHB-868]MDA0212038.1 nickel ABC transporter permease subunit NikC [Cyanobacteria bacterium FC1]